MVLGSAKSHFQKKMSVEKQNMCSQNYRPILNYAVVIIILVFVFRFSRWLLLRQWPSVMLHHVVWWVCRSVVRNILSPFHGDNLVQVNVSHLNLNQNFRADHLYRVSQEERAKLREGVPYVKLYRYNPKHLFLKLNGYGDNGQRSLKL